MYGEYEPVVGLEYDVETSYSYGHLWTFWNRYDDVNKARHACKMLIRSSPDCFRVRIIRKEVIE